VDNGWYRLLRRHDRVREPAQAAAEETDYPLFWSLLI